MMDRRVTKNWDATKCADLLRMVKSGSILESMMDEFALSRPQLRDAIEEVKAMPPAVLAAAAPKAAEPAPKAEAPMKRTSEGLREKLFDAMDGLMSGAVDPQVALAACAVSQAICKTVELEIRAGHHLHSIGKTVLEPLPLGDK